MPVSRDQPVVIGSGLCGMAISDRLTQAGVSHVLLGEPPGEQPRLGESLDPAGTLQLLQLYPEFDEFYYEKRWISVFGGDYATACNFGQKLVRTFGLRMLGYRSPPEFIHMDRIGFDRAMYERVAASEYCTWIESRVEAVDYDQQTDTIERLDLGDGETIRPAFVFDCTNHVRLLGRSLELPVEWLGEPQRVVFSDYHTPSGTSGIDQIDEKWKHSTNLVRLYDDMDGLDGVAWAIPLGSYISVGISMPKAEDDLEADTVLSRVEDAYRRRGMGFLHVFDHPEPAVTVPHQQYFYHDRAFGRNWLLAGSSYGQVWFPSGSGVGSSLVAAQIAPSVLDHTEKLGRQYEAYVDGLRESHRSFDRMITLDYENMSADLVKTESSRIVAENVKRVARLASIQKGPLATGVAWLLMKAVSYDGVAEGDCEVYETDLGEQTHTIFAHE